MRAIAAQLPFQTQEGMLVVKGEDLIRATGRIGTTKEGDPIESDKFYKVPVQQRVNHYRRIKKLFNAGGYQRVNEYIDGVIRLHAEVQHAKVMQGFESAMPKMVI